MVHHRPERPTPSSPAVPPPPDAFASVPPLWRTGQWQGASRSENVREPECHSGGTVGGGGFPHPKLPQYPRHAGGESVPASPSSSLSVPDTPQPGNSAVFPRQGRPSGTYVVPHQGPWLPNSASPPLLSQ